MIRGRTGFDWILFLACLVAVGCSQEGSVAVHNDTPRRVTGTIDALGFTADSGEVAVQKVAIGKKFITGPSDRHVEVIGKGPCVSPFTRDAYVRPGTTSHMTIEADAALVHVCNHTGTIAVIYIEFCSGPDWVLLGGLYGGQCADLWVPAGCYRFRANSGYTDALHIELCDEWNVDYGSTKPGEVPGLRIETAAGRVRSETGGRPAKQLLTLDQAIRLRRQAGQPVPSDARRD
jgi:hypothetical protein